MEKQETLEGNDTSIPKLKIKCLPIIQTRTKASTNQ